MRSIYELIGIVKGISYDGIINDREVVRLQGWADKNRNFTFDSKEVELVKAIDEILEDGIVDDDERDYLLLKAEELAMDLPSENAKVYELNGIVEGIICDNVVNEPEIRNLKKWMDINGDFITDHKPSEDLRVAIEDILADGIVTAEEQGSLLKMLRYRMQGSKFETKLEHLRHQVRERKNIGIELIDLLDNEEAMDRIHQQAEQQLRYALNSYSGRSLKDPEIVFISLVLIGMLKYDGNFYDNVADEYPGLYGRYSEQKIEGFIRSLLARYRTPEMRTTGRNSYLQVALLNTIVPGNYLASFFEFIYDIYKLNFDGSLSTYDLTEDFKFVYEGLSANLRDDVDDIKVNVTSKTYKLISTTKQIIKDQEHIEAIIKLSIIVVKLIDKKIWDKQIKIVNPYLKKGFEEWEKTLEKDLAAQRGTGTVSDIRSRWEPVYQLDGNDVYLVPPVHRIKATYDYRTISVVVSNGSEELYANTRPDIREIIGGYEVNLQRIHLTDPIGKISYKLLSGNEVIYSSDQKLYRDFLVFNREGKEIKNNTDYEGTVIICHSQQWGNIEDYYIGETFRVGSKNVKNGSSLEIEGKIFNFFSLTRPGIVGELYPGHYLQDVARGTELPVYRFIRYLVFESNVPDAKYYIEINGRLKGLKHYKYTAIDNHGVTKYTVTLSDFEPQVYRCSVIQESQGRRSRIFNTTFVLDSDLKYDQLQIDESKYLITLESSLFEDIYEEEFQISDLSDNGITFSLDETEYAYKIPFKLNIHRLDAGPWESDQKDLWIDDIKSDSILELYGNMNDGLIVYSEHGVILEQITNIRNKSNCQQIPVGFLLSYKTAYAYIMLVFTINGTMNKTLFCYNRCVFRRDKTRIDYDPVTKKMSVYAEYYGRGRVYCTIDDSDGNIVFKSGFMNSGDTVESGPLASFREYTINFYQKEKGLSLKKNKLLKSYRKRVISWDDMVGHSFRIREVFYDQMTNRGLVRKNYILPATWVKINSKKSDGYYNGAVFVKGFRKNYWMNNINPVDVEICSSEMDGRVEISITNAGDGLLLNFEKKTVLNAADDKYAPDIYSYMIEFSGEF